MPPQSLACAVPARPIASAPARKARQNLRMLLISHSGAVSARIGPAPQRAVRERHGMGMAGLGEPVGDGQNVVPAADEGLADLGGDPALQPDSIWRVAGRDFPVHEARPLDGLWISMPKSSALVP